MILGEKAILEAKGADAKDDKNQSSHGGGGGGGVISITCTKRLVEEAPTPSINTKGGEGAVPGDHGLVVLNGTFNGLLFFLRLIAF